MLKIVNQFWQYDTEEELNCFLDSCMSDNTNEFLIERYGKSRNGKYYAYGSVVPTNKFSRSEKGENTDVKSELNLG